MDKYKSSCTEDHSKMTKISCLAIGQGIEGKKEFLDCGSGGSRFGIILSFNASSPGKKQKDHFILLCTMNTFGSSWISSPGLDDNLSADLAWPNPLVTKSVKLCCKGLPDQTRHSCNTSKYEKKLLKRKRFQDFFSVMCKIWTHYFHIWSYFQQSISPTRGALWRFLSGWLSIFMSVLLTKRIWQCPSFVCVWK